MSYYAQTDNVRVHGGLLFLSNTMFQVSPIWWLHQTKLGEGRLSQITRENTFAHLDLSRNDNLATNLLIYFKI